MKKTILLAQSLLLSSAMYCQEPSGPIAQEFRKLEATGGTTEDFLATVEGKAQQVAKEVSQIKLVLDTYQSEGSIDTWSTARNKLVSIAQLIRTGEEGWIGETVDLIRNIPHYSEQDSNVHGNMQIMFEAGSKPNTPVPNGLVECEPEKADYISFQVRLTPTDINLPASSIAWIKTISCLIDVIKRVSNEGCSQEDTANAVETLSELITECHNATDHIKVEAEITFYAAAVVPETPISA